MDNLKNLLLVLSALRTNIITHKFVDDLDKTILLLAEEVKKGELMTQKSGEASSETIIEELKEEASYLVNPCGIRNHLDKVLDLIERL